MITLEKLTSYKIASELSDHIWFVVNKWSVLAQKTLGEQIIRSSDSIAANIIEGEGRFFKKDKIRFFYQARASAYETIHWVDKARARRLLNEDQYQKISTEVSKLPKEINFLIANTSNNLKK